jgi:hypothetical protein
MFSELLSGLRLLLIGKCPSQMSHMLANRLTLGH